MKFTPLVAMAVIAVASAQESSAAWPSPSHTMMTKPHNDNDPMHSAAPTYVACPGDDMDNDNDNNNNGGVVVPGDNDMDNDNNDNNDNNNNGGVAVPGDNDNDMDNDGNDNDNGAQPTTVPTTGAGATNAIGSLAIAGAIAAYVL